MTAKVHASMQLGVLASGDLSFEPLDALMELDPTAEELRLRVLADAFELDVPGRPRCRELTVSPQTHVVLDFLGHTLDLDNDFARPRPVGEVLEVHLLRLGEQRPSLGPLSAGHHGDDIVLAESGVDHVQREHALARSERQANELDRPARPELRVPLIAAAAMLLILGAIGLSAVLGSRQVPEAEAPVAAPVQQPPLQAPAADGVVAARVSPDVMERFAALVAADPLPDKASLDFAIESLKSLRLAYPGDPSVGVALERLTERLVNEARLAYDRGDAFAAGRLIEQASSTGVSQSLVARTLDAFSSRAPGAASAEITAAEPAPDLDSGPMPAEVADAENAALAAAGGTALADSADADTAAAPASAPDPAATQSAAAAESAEDEEGSAAAIAALAGAAAVAASAQNEADESPAEAPLSSQEAVAAGAVAAPVAATGSANRSTEATLRQPAATNTAAPDTATLEPVESMVVAETPTEAETATVAESTAVSDTDALADEAAPAVSADAQADAGSGELDALVTSATGLALGALSVELIVNGATAPAASDVAAAPAGNLVVNNPTLEPVYAPDSLEGRVRETLAPFLDEPTAPSASRLPDGFAQEDASAFSAQPASYDLTDDLEAIAASTVPSGPRFFPFSELTPTFQEPLTYPRRIIDTGGGFVDVEFSVNERGRVADLVVLGEPQPIFARSASRTLRRWRFEPVLVDGKPVTVRTGLRVTFQNPN